MVPAPRMSNVLSENKREQVLALGRLGWSLRKIERAVGVRRETAKLYLKAAGMAIRGPRQQQLSKAASPEPVVITDYLREKAEISEGADESKAASCGEVITDYLGDEALCAAGASPWPPQSTSRVQSQCEPYRDIVERALGLGKSSSTSTTTRARTTACDVS